MCQLPSSISISGPLLSHPELGKKNTRNGQTQHPNNQASPSLVSQTEPPPLRLFGGNSCRLDCRVHGQLPRPENRFLIFHAISLAQILTITFTRLKSLRRYRIKHNKKPKRKTPANVRRVNWAMMEKYINAGLPLLKL